MLQEHAGIFRQGKKVTFVLENPDEALLGQIFLTIAGNLHSGARANEQLGIYKQDGKVTLTFFGARSALLNQIYRLLIQDTPKEYQPQVEDLNDLTPQTPELSASFYSSVDLDSMESARVNDLSAFFEDDPFGTLDALLDLSKSGNDADPYLAGKRFGELLARVPEDPDASKDVFAELLVKYYLEPNFIETLAKMAAQKGCGNQMPIPSPEYSRAVEDVVRICREEDLKNALAAIAARYQNPVRW